MLHDFQIARLSRVSNQRSNLHLAYLGSHLPCLTFFCVSGDGDTNDFSLPFFHLARERPNASDSLIQCLSNNIGREGLLAIRTLALLESHRCHSLPAKEKSAVPLLGVPHTHMQAEQSRGAESFGVALGHVRVLGSPETHGEQQQSDCVDQGASDLIGCVLSHQAGVVMAVLWEMSLRA